MTTMLLIRHCQSTGQAPDAPLTAQGLTDAAAFAAELHAHAVDAVFSSPFTRARQTVAPFAERHGLKIGIDDRLAERRLSAEPRPDWMDHIRRSFADLDHRAPGGESLREARHHGLAALAEIAGIGHRLLAVSTHGNLLAALLHSVDPGFGFADWEQLRNPDLFRLTFDGGRPVAFERLTCSCGVGRSTAAAPSRGTAG
jgi:2,3-bisphosphoglycerate-dependent phosphoglycerate mutase